MICGWKTDGRNLAREEHFNASWMGEGLVKYSLAYYISVRSGIEREGASSDSEAQCLTRVR